MCEENKCYYLGLDIGSGSVGWAAVTPDHELLKVNGRDTWGINLFDKGRTMKKRGVYRSARRRYNRRHDRLLLIRSLFKNEIDKVDPSFFIRMDDSMLKGHDCDEKSFGKCLKDMDFYRLFPTVYHLRYFLMKTDEKPDIRLFYLAVNNLVKKSGHFIFDQSTENTTGLKDAIIEFLESSAETGHSVSITDIDVLCDVLTDCCLNDSSRKSGLKGILAFDDSVSAISSLLSGGKCRLSGLFHAYDSEIPLCMGDMSDMETEDQLKQVLNSGDLHILHLLKNVYDIAIVIRKLHGYDTVSEMKVAEYERHRSGLHMLKAAVHQYAAEHYRAIFRGPGSKYSAYAQKRSVKSKERLTQTDFCRYVYRILQGTGIEDDQRFSEMMDDLNNNELLPRQKTENNVLLPNSVHKKELGSILDNMCRFYPFLSEKDDSGLSVRDRIMMIQGFRIPYFIGPLDTRSENSWVVRKSFERVLPWNIEQVIDMERSAENFMTSKIGKCRRIPWEPVLPKNSLIYSRFLYYNIVNPICVNEDHLTYELKSALMRDVFERTDKNITIYDIKNFIKSREEYADKNVYISGMHETVDNPTRSIQIMRRALGYKAEDLALCEHIIRICTTFTDKDMVGRMLLKGYSDVLTDSEIEKIKNIRFTGWGNFSEKFLIGMYETESHSGRLMNLVEMMARSSCRMDEVLERYPFDEHIRNCDEHTDYRDVDRYINENIASSMTKRTLFRMISVVKDVVRHMGGPPSKIFIEQTGIKGTDPGLNRKQVLVRLYRHAKEEPSWISSLERCSDAELRNRRTYLYYTQLGRCMYCGRRLMPDGSGKIPGADLDHIYPRSVLRDDSLSNNMVLTCRSCNEIKGSRYPLDRDVVERMRPMWVSLHGKRYISDTKFFRLLGSEPIARVSFTSSQLSETGRSVIHAVKLLNMMYGGATEIVSVSGEISSELRQKNGMVKCRSVNDLHHAEDAYLCIVAGDADGRTRLNDKEVSVMGSSDIRYTRNPHTEHGQLFRDNLYPAGEGTVARKRGMDPGSYGGYRNTSKAFYSLVRYRLLKHIVNAIEPVESYAGVSPDDTAAIARYHEKVLGKETEILMPCIKCDSTLDWGGMRVTVRGLSNNRINVMPAVQFKVSRKISAYCRKLYNYDRDSRGGCLMNICNYGLSAEENRFLYDHVLSRLESEPYRYVMSAVADNLRKCREAFNGSDLRVQSRILNQVLKTIQCNPSRADLSEVGGAAVCGNLQLKGRLPKCSDVPVYLVHQSPSGLSEHRVLLNPDP